MLLVQALVAEDQDKHFREAECPFTCHVVLNFFLHFLQVRLVVKLDPMRISNGDIQLASRLNKAFVHVVGSVVIAATVRVSSRSHVAHDPLFVAQIDSFLNGETPHDILIDMNHLVLLEDLRFW